MGLALLYTPRYGLPRYARCVASERTAYSRATPCGWPAPAGLHRLACTGWPHSPRGARAAGGAVRIEEGHPHRRSLQAVRRPGRPAARGGPPLYDGSPGGTSRPSRGGPPLAAGLLLADGLGRVSLRLTRCFLKQRLKLLTFEVFVFQQGVGQFMELVGVFAENFARQVTAFVEDAQHFAVDKDGERGAATAGSRRGHAHGKGTLRWAFIAVEA